MHLILISYSKFINPCEITSNSRKKFLPVIAMYEYISQHPDTDTNVNN